MGMIGRVFFFCRSPTVKKLQEYLFFVLDPSLPGGDNQLMCLLEEGAMDANTYKVSEMLDFAVQQH